MNAIEELWIYPPLCFARVGGAPDPLDSFSWGPNAVSPRGSGKTTLVPAETLDIDASGMVSSRMPEFIRFKEVIDSREVFRPVCPWFEVHGRWTIGGQTASGPITAEVLRDCGVDVGQVRWSIEVANRKAYNMTLSDGDVIAAGLEIAGDDTTAKPLLATSTGSNPLVLATHPLPFGTVQVARLSPAFPELRFRFSPPVGTTYWAAFTANQDRDARRAVS